MKGLAWQPPSGFADVINGADVRVVQRGSGPRLALEPVQRETISRETLRQALQRDPPAETRVLRFVDLAHAAGPERRDDAVAADGSAGTRLTATSTEVVGGNRA